MHQLHPSHFSSSIMITPVCSDCFKASLGQAVTHGAGLQSLHVTDMLMSGCSRIVRILDLCALKAFSLVSEHMYSQTEQPVHFCGAPGTSFHLDASVFGTVAILAHLEVLQHRERGEDLPSLGHVGDPEPGSFSIVGT